jgi:hypothetical protein
MLQFGHFRALQNRLALARGHAEFASAAAKKARVVLRAGADRAPD